MNITFLLGNGFDLNLGLKTSYSKFLAHYLNQPCSKGGVIDRFKKSIALDLDSWTDVELAIGQCTREFLGETAGKDFMACYDDMYDCLAAYLAEEERRFAACSRDRLRDGMTQALCSWQEGFRSSRKAEIVRRFSRCMGGFNYDFITFNYTRTIDACLSAAEYAPLGSRLTYLGDQRNTIARSVHVHGYTNKDMILGVNDETQIANPRVLMNQLSFDRDRLVKPKANHLCEEGTDEAAHRVLRESDLAYIYGMSIGETDRIWWERLARLMNEKPHLQVLIFAYDAPEDQLHYHRFLKFESELQQKLLSYFSVIPPDALDRIHVTGHNVFAGLKDLAVNLEA